MNGKMTKLQAINNKILAIKGKFHIEKTESGIYLPDISDKATGLVPRWFQVYSVGEDIDWLKPGQWIYVAYGRWSEGFKVDGIDETIWLIDDKQCLAVSDEEPTGDSLFNEDTSKVNPGSLSRDPNAIWDDG